MAGSIGTAAFHRGRRIPKMTYRESDGVYFYRPSNKVGRIKLGTLTPQQAWDYAMQHDREPEETFTVARKLTVAAFWDILVSTARETGSVSEDYLAIHEARWKQNIEPLLGKKKMHEVTTSHIRSVYTAMRSRTPKPYAENTIKQARSTMSWIWRSAMSPDFDSVVKSNPVRDVEMGKPKSSTTAVTVDKVITEEEFAALIEHYSDRPMYQAVIQTARLTGLRLREVLALQWSDLDFDGAHPTIFVERQLTQRPVPGVGYATRPLKGDTAHRRKHVRKILMPAQLKAVLQAHRAWMLSEGLSVFPQSKLFCNSAGLPLDPHVVAKSLRSTRGKALREGVTFHCFRHTFASEAYNQGVPLRVISEHLGHASEAITEGIYAHFKKRDSDYAAMQAGIKWLG